MKVMRPSVSHQSILRFNKLMNTILVWMHKGVSCMIEARLTNNVPQRAGSLFLRVVKMRKNKMWKKILKNNIRVDNFFLHAQCVCKIQQRFFFAHSLKNSHSQGQAWWYLLRKGSQNHHIKHNQNYFSSQLVNITAWMVGSWTRKK